MEDDRLIIEMLKNEVRKLGQKRCIEIVNECLVNSDEKKNLKKCLIKVIQILENEVEE